MFVVYLHFLHAELTFQNGQPVLSVLFFPPALASNFVDFLLARDRTDHIPTPFFVTTQSLALLCTFHILMCNLSGLDLDVWC